MEYLGKRALEIHSQDHVFQPKVGLHQEPLKMIVVRHRINTVEVLQDCDPRHGIEVDIRSDSDGLYLSHDPFAPGERLPYFLDNYQHELLIINVKEDGLEDAIVIELSRKGIENYFFLDQADPTIVRRGKAGIQDAAIRFSEYESLETVRSMAHFASWVWIDSFSKRDLSAELISEFKSLGLKTCLVSPELHGLERAPEADDLIRQCSRLGLRLDAVCTKYPTKWKALG